MNSQDKTYSFCITSIKNHLKKENYRNLLEDYTDGVINFEEYQKKLNDFPDKYTINLHKFDSEEDIDIITSIMKDIDSRIYDLSINDVGEMFSIDPTSFSSEINKKEK